MPRKITKKGTKTIKEEDYKYLPESIELKRNMNLGKKFPPQANLDKIRRHGPHSAKT